MAAVECNDFLFVIIGLNLSKHLINSILPLMRWSVKFAQLSACWISIIGRLFVVLGFQIPNYRQQPFITAHVALSRCTIYRFEVISTASLGTCDYTSSLRTCSITLDVFNDIKGNRRHFSRSITTGQVQIIASLL